MRELSTEINVTYLSTKSDRALPKALILEQSGISPSQISLYQPMLNPDRAYSNALELKPNFNLSHLQYPYLSHQLSRPERAHPNALVMEQSVSSSTRTPLYQHLLTPERALPNALELKLLKLSPLQHLYSSQQLPNPERAHTNALELA